MSEAKSCNREIVKNYYWQLNEGKVPVHLVSEHFRFWYPKYDFGHGVTEFFEMVGAIDLNQRPALCHIEKFPFVEQRNRVVVEGTAEGGEGGTRWHGEQTSGGRFCAVFTLSAVGLIGDRRIYTDPDVTGAHKARFFGRNAPHHER